MIRLKGRIRLLVSASRSSAALLPLNSAAAPPAAAPVLRACLRAVCWRPRARPPFCAARLRAVLPLPLLERDVERELPERLVPVERERELVLRDDELRAPLERDDEPPRDDDPLRDEEPLRDDELRPPDDREPEEDDRPLDPLEDERRPPREDPPPLPPDV